MGCFLKRQCSFADVCAGDVQGVPRGKSREASSEAVLREILQGMSFNLLICLLVIGTLFLCVFALAPLYAVWSWHRLRATSKHFLTLCRIVGAKGDADEQLQTVVRGDHRIHLVRLSESMRLTFEEAPLRALPWWLLNYTSNWFWLFETNSSKLLKEFPYHRININNGPLLLLLSSCILPLPFVITAGKNRRTRDDRREQMYGDREFDQLVSVRCDDPGFMRGYLTPSRRSAILQLFELGFTHVMYVKQTRSLILVSNSRFLVRDTNTHAGPQVLDLFIKIAPESSGLTHFEKEGIRVSQVARGQDRVFEYNTNLLMAPLGVLGIIYFFGHHAAVHMVPSTGFIGLQVVVSGLLLLFMALFLRDFIRRLGVWFVLVIIALPLGVGRGMALLNRTLDRSTPQAVVATVGDVSTHSFLAGPRYERSFETHYVVELRFSGPQSQTRRAALEIPEDLLDRVRAGNGLECRIFLRSGALGFEHLTGKIELPD